MDNLVGSAPDPRSMSPIDLLSNPNPSTLHRYRAATNHLSLKGTSDSHRVQLRAFRRMAGPGYRVDSRYASVSLGLGANP